MVRVIPKGNSQREVSSEFNSQQPVYPVVVGNGFLVLEGEGLENVQKHTHTSDMLVCYLEVSSYPNFLGFIVLGNCQFIVDSWLLWHLMGPLSIANHWQVNSY